MATEIQNIYSNRIYGCDYSRCSGLERHRIDILIERKTLGEFKEKDETII